MSTFTLTVTAETVTVTNHLNDASFTLTDVYADVARRLVAARLGVAMNGREDRVEVVVKDR